MARIIAIDYGGKRTGIAATDPLQIIASPVETIHSKDLVPYLKAYVAREEVEAFVVGMPLQSNGQPTDATPMAKGCVTILKKNFPEIPVHLQDERYTSVMAQQAVIAGGVKKKDRRQKGLLDKVSAAIILQSYLERTK